MAAGYVIAILIAAIGALVAIRNMKPQVVTRYCPGVSYPKTIPR